MFIIWFALLELIAQGIKPNYLSVIYIKVETTFSKFKFLKQQIFRIPLFQTALHKTMKGLIEEISLEN